MADKNQSRMIDQLNDFFNERSSHIPRLCFPETNPEIRERSYFIISLSKEIPDTILKDIQGHNFNILSCQLEKIDDMYLSYMIVRNDDDDNDMNKLEALLKNNKGIVNHKIKELTSLERNPFTYPVKLHSGIKRSLLLDHDLFHALFRTITSGLGSGGDYLMYMSGISVADNIWNKYGIGDQEELDDQFLLLEDVLRTIGFGMVAFENIDPLRSEGKIIIKHSIEQTMSDSCPLLRGLFTELLRRMFEDPNIEVIETACVNRGDKECIFELTRVKTI